MKASRSSVHGSGEVDMRVGRDTEQHVTYCLNVHAGETWDDNLAAIERYACEVRDRLAVDAPFGLGLRLSAIAAESLAQVETRRRHEFRRGGDLSRQQGHR